MTSSSAIISIVVASSLLMGVGCSESSTEPEPQKIPLDGRGGGVIAYCYQGGDLHRLFAVNADGSGKTRLIEASIGLNHHDWSPNGQQIACVGYVGSDFATWSIYVFGIDGTGLTRLTTIADVWDSEPVWSPDGGSIVFTRMYPNENNREEIWLMNADGSNQHYIGISGVAARWSPDGSRLVYSSRRSGNSELYTCNVDATDEVQLTSTTADEVFPAWSPDGTQIAYSASTGNYDDFSSNRITYEIYIMNCDGTSVNRITDNQAYDGYPRWSPSGTMLAFDSDRHEATKWEVYTMNVDGTNARRVTQSPVNVTAINPVWKPVL